MLRIFHNTTYGFVRWWRYAAVLTLAFISIGVVDFAISGGVNYSIEFTGGTLMQVQFKTPPDVAVLRKTLDDAGISGAEIQQFGAATDYTIRAREKGQVEAQDAGAEGISKTISTTLENQFGAGQVTIIRTEAVGPKVGSELRNGAAMAMLIASLFTLMYLGMRFDWRFGLAAVLSTTHDIIITLVYIKVAHLEVSLTVVAAILTLVGYSANDTIIIFDRVRENLRKPHKGESLPQILDRSINETLPRSIMTHASTLVAILALLILAGEVIRPFAWVMTFGVFVATFSSIYVAGPLLLYIEHRWPRTDDAATSRAVRAAKEVGTSVNTGSGPSRRVADKVPAR